MKLYALCTLHEVRLISWPSSCSTLLNHRPPDFSSIRLCNSLTALLIFMSIIVLFRLDGVLAPVSVMLLLPQLPPMRITHGTRRRIILIINHNNSRHFRPSVTHRVRSPSKTHQHRQHRQHQYTHHDSKGTNKQGMDNLEGGASSMIM